MGEILAVVLLLTSPFWVLMLLNAGKDRSRVQAISGTVEAFARLLNLDLRREGANVIISGEYDGVPLELVATNLETSPRILIQVSLPTSLKGLSFRSREGYKGPRYDTNDKNFDAVVVADGDPMWLAAILDAPTRGAIVSLVLSHSAKVENGIFSAEVPIMLEEDQQADQAAPPPPPPPPPTDGVTITLGSDKPQLDGAMGYLVGSVEKMCSVAKAMLAQTAVKVERLVTIAKEETPTGIRLGALKGLMVMQRPERVAGFVNDADPVVRLYACAQVGDIGLPGLENLLSEFPGVSLPADLRLPPERTVDALKTFRAPKDLARLRPLMIRFCRSADHNIRHAAFHTVVRLGLPDLLSLFSALPDLAEDRLPLIQNLVLLGDAQAEHILWRLLSAPEDTVRGKAIEALVQIGSALSVPVLEAYAIGKFPDPPKALPSVNGTPSPVVQEKPPEAAAPGPDRPPVISITLQKAAREAAIALQRRLDTPPPPPKTEDKAKKDPAKPRPSNIVANSSVSTAPVEPPPPPPPVPEPILKESSSGRYPRPKIPTEPPPV